MGAIMSESRPARPPDGAELAFDVASAKLDDQLKQVDPLDQKIGVTIAALVTIAAAFYAIQPPLVVAGVVSVLLLSALVQATRAFHVGNYADAPDARRLALYAGDSPAAMKWQALPAILDAIDENRPKLIWKGRYLNQAVFTIAVVGGGALLAKLVGAV